MAGSECQLVCTQQVECPSHCPGSIVTVSPAWESSRAGENKRVLHFVYTVSRAAGRAEQLNHRNLGLNLDNLWWYRS